MNLVSCVTAVLPCPLEDQRLIALSEAIDPVSLGITGSSVLYVFSWGFGAVLFGWLLGLGVSAALGMIRKI